MNTKQRLISMVARPTTTAKISIPQQRRGAVIPLVAIMLVVILGMVAFAIDIGFIALADTELQRTADACAIAAVQQLPSTTAAVAAAQELADQNRGSAGPSLTVSDIEFGHWDRDTATFSLGGYQINAAKVTLNRTDANGNPLNLYWAPILGTSHADVTATAIAMYDENMCGPLIGIEWVSVPGEPTTDSFRSSQGGYASQAPRDNGSICSDGPIGLEGNPVVNGDANAGKDFSTTLSGASIVTGNTTPRLRPLNLPDVDFADYEQNNDNDLLPGIPKGKNLVSPVDAQGNFLVDGGKTYEMPPGTYYFQDFTLTGNSTLKISGPTNIYLTGNFDTAGGYLINNTQAASNLRIFMNGGSATVTSKVDLYAVIYAPNTTVELRGSADFYGAVVGRTLLATGSGDIHYDEDLDIADALDLPRRVSLVQ